MLAMGQTHCQALNTHYQGWFSAPSSWTSLHTGKLCVLGQFTIVLTLVRQGEEKTSGLVSELFIQIKVYQDLRTPEPHPGSPSVPKGQRQSLEAA